MSGPELMTGAGLAGVAGAAWLVRARFWPYGPCPACRGRRGRGIASTSTSWSHCHRCGGSGEVLRLSAKVWRRWRRDPGDR